MKPLKRRYALVWPGYVGGPEWLCSPPPTPGWAMYYALKDGTMAPHREAPAAMLDLKTGAVLPLYHFVMKAAQA